MEIHIFEFPKIAKKITGVGRVETHTRDFFIFKIVVFWAVQKRQILTDFKILNPGMSIQKFVF
jgi:hypothetical protein